jgi:hypothetical protein
MPKHPHISVCYLPFGNINMSLVIRAQFTEDRSDKQTTATRAVVCEVVDWHFENLGKTTGF